MPNHVQNIVTITGSKGRLSEFADFVRDEDRSFSFDKIIPMPESLHIVDGGDLKDAMVLAVVRKLRLGTQVMLHLRASENERLLSSLEHFLLGMNCKDVGFDADKKIDTMDIAEREATASKLLSLIHQKLDIFSPVWNGDLYGSICSSLSRFAERDVESFFIKERSFSGYDADRSPKNAADIVWYGDVALNNLLEYGCATWYTWSCANWGTKWNAYDICPAEPSDEELQYTFFTAWSFPEPIFQKLVELFPDLSIDWLYADEDIGSNCAHVSASDGVIVSHPVGDAIEFACDIWGYDPDEYRGEEYE